MQIVADEADPLVRGSLCFLVGFARRLASADRAARRYCGFTVEQQVRFCSSDDGVRVAYAVHGRGPAIVRVANWLTHLEHDWHSPIWRHWLSEFGRGHTFVRYDCRGCGLPIGARPR